MAWPGPALGPSQSLELLNDLSSCSDSESNQNEMELQSDETFDSRHKCSGQNQPPPSYQNQVQSECGVGPSLDVGQTKANSFTCQEPEVEGISSAR